MECVITKGYQTSSRIMFLFLEAAKHNLSAFFSSLFVRSWWELRSDKPRMATLYQQLNTKPLAKDENASLIFPSDSFRHNKENVANNFKIKYDGSKLSVITKCPYSCLLTAVCVLFLIKLRLVIGIRKLGDSH